MAKIAVTGIPELDRAIKQLGTKVANKLVRGALREAAKELAADVKEEVPVDTGTLKKNIKVKAIKRSRTRIGMQVLVEDATGEGESTIAAHVEYGTSKMEGDPFMRRALDQNATEVKNTAMDGIEAAINEAIKEVTK